MSRTRFSDLHLHFPGKRIQVAMARVMEAHDRELVPFGITVRQLVALSFCNDEKADNLSELAELTVTDLSSASRMVSRLVEKGLVERKPGKDRRSMHLKLTPKGQDLYDRALPVASSFAKKLWRDVTDQEKRALDSAVDKIESRLSELSGPKGTRPIRKERSR